jgi:hypothetical protein
MLSLNFESLSDGLLRGLGVGSAVGGLKRLNILAVKDNPQVSNAGWFTFCLNK